MITAFEQDRQDRNDVFGRASIARHQTESERDAFRSAATLANRTEYATMTLDSCGRICDCGATAEEIFGASRLNLIGRPIFKFIAGLSRGRSSPSYGARYLEYLCADGEWHEFEATDMGGRAFAVELSMHRTQTSSRELFALRLRQPKQTACP